MVAYGHLYQCADLLLLYPHNRELSSPAGPLSAHSIVNTSSQLRAATIDLTEASSQAWREILGLGCLWR